MADVEDKGPGGIEPADLREPVPSERIRAMPMVSVALGSLALGFCIVYFVCRPEAIDRSAESRPIAGESSEGEPGRAGGGSNGDVRTAADAGSAAPAAPSTPGALPQAAPPSPEPVPPQSQPQAAPPSDPVPAASDAGAASPSVFGSRLTLSSVEIRKCAGIDGIEVPRERCGRVRGMELFMTRNEGAVKDCIESSFEVPSERPALFGITLAVNFETKVMAVTIPGADEIRATQFAALKECLSRALGSPEFDRIEHPHNQYRFMFQYSYSQ